MHALTKKIIEDLKHQKVVPFDEIKKSEDHIQQLLQNRQDNEIYEMLHELDPVFHLYLLTIECVSRVIPILSKHDALKETNKKWHEIQKKKYRPGSWDSSITDSFCMLWWYFDAHIDDNLTLGKLCLEVLNELGYLNENLFRLIEKGNQSRLLVGSVLDHEDHYVYLKELVTEREIQTICPTKYQGKKGEIWLVRLFPPVEEGTASTILTTPYIIHNTSTEDWISYFASQKIDMQMLDVKFGMEKFMKESASTDYWLQYIFSTPPSLDFVECRHISGIP